MKGEFYKMDFRAWNVGTIDLTLEQEAAYLRLCHAMYDVGGPVPASTRFLQSIFRCGNTKAVTLVAQLVAAGKIIVTESGALFNRRVSDELATRERVSSGRRAAGERGGNASGASRAKSLENNETGEARASMQPNQIRGEEIREETPSSPSNDDGSEQPALFEGIENVTPLKRRESTKSSKAVIEAAFEQFWSAYPRREGSNPRKPACEKFARAIEAGADPEAIIAGARRYAADMRRTEKIGTGYVAQSVTWLNQQRWADDHQPNAPPAGKWHMV